MHPQKIGWWVLEKTRGDWSCLVGLETASYFLFLGRACASSSFKFEGFFYFGVRNQRESFWWKWTVVQIVQIKIQGKNVATSKHAIFSSSLLFVRGTQYSHWHVNWIEFEFGEERFGIIFPFAGNSRSKAPAPKGVPHLTHQIRSKCVYHSCLIQHWLNTRHWFN